MKKPFWFPFCPNDFLSSSKVAVMTTEEIGAYVLLLCHEWNDPDCSLPNDDKMLQKLCRFSGNMETIRACFVTIDDRIVNERLLSEAKKTKSIQRHRSKSGKAGAAKRWHGKCHVVAIANDQQTDAQLQLQSQLHIHKEEEGEIPAPPDHKIKPEELRVRWNQIQGVKLCKTIGGALEGKLKRLCKEHDWPWWEALFVEVAKSPFLTGRTSGRDGQAPFRANLDWVTGPINLGKILAGNYDDGGNQLAPKKRILLT